ncbi:hypothetical protein GCM10027286_24390 [Virgibacillus ainsalahensis]
MEQYRKDISKGMESGLHSWRMEMTVPSLSQLNVLVCLHFIRSTDRKLSNVIHSKLIIKLYKLR